MAETVVPNEVVAVDRWSYAHFTRHIRKCKGSYQGVAHNRFSADPPRPFYFRYNASMLAKLQTFSLLGIEALPVEVEVDVSPGALPKTVLVGLPEAAVKESTHRVERAIANSGFLRPQDRIVINLAPACCLLESTPTARPRWT